MTSDVRAGHIGLAAGLLWILSGVPAHANLIINPSFDGSVPSSAQAAFNTAAAVLEGLYAYTGGANTITVNIDVTFAGSCTGNCLGSTTQTLVQTTYSAWRTAMQTDSTANPGNPFLADGIAASLPAGSSPLGSDIVQITQANANVLGLFTPSGGAEATIAFSPDQPYEYTGVATSGDYDFINVAEHEMDETLAIGTALNTGFGLPGYMPVSYTHLDVYKRQAVGCLVLWNRGVISATLRQFASRGRFRRIPAGVLRRDSAGHVGERDSSEVPEGDRALVLRQDSGRGLRIRPREFDRGGAGNGNHGVFSK